MIGRSVVEVYTHGEHTRQDLDWRLDVEYAVLEGPRAEALDIFPFMNGDGEILVPRNYPVRFGTLIEPSDLDRPGLTPQDLSRQSRGRPFGGERSYRVRFQAKATDAASPVHRRSQAGELSLEQDDLSLRKSGLRHRIAVQIQLDSVHTCRLSITDCLAPPTGQTRPPLPCLQFFQVTVKSSRDGLRKIRGMEAIILNFT
jgi:hypothetical protein